MTGQPDDNSKPNAGRSQNGRPAGVSGSPESNGHPDSNGHPKNNGHSKQSKPDKPGKWHQFADGNWKYLKDGIPPQDPAAPSPPDALVLGPGKKDREAEEAAFDLEMDLDLGPETGSPKKPVRPKSGKGSAKSKSEPEPVYVQAESKTDSSQSSQSSQNQQFEPPRNSSDAEIPESFFSFSESGLDPAFIANIERTQEVIFRSHDEFFPFADQHQRTDTSPGELAPAGPSWHELTARNMPLKMAFSEQAAGFALALAMRPKVECTYGPAGKLRSKKVSSPSPAAIATCISVHNECLERELKFAEKMRPAASSTQNQVVLPEGCDEKTHAVWQILLKGIATAQVLKESESQAG